MFGEGGPLADIDFPDVDLSHINIPEINLPGFPEIELPDLDLPDLDEIQESVQIKIDAAKAKAQASIDAARDKVADRLESVIDRIENRFPDSDLPGRLEDLPGRLEDLIDRAHGVLDDILDHETTTASTLLTSASLPPVAVQAIQSAFSSAGVYSLPVSGVAVSIPEPTTAVLGAAGLLLAGVASRRRRAPAKQRLSTTINKPRLLRRPRFRFARSVGGPIRSGRTAVSSAEPASSTRSVVVAEQRRASGR